MACTTQKALAWLAIAIAAPLAAQRTPDEALRALQDGNRRFAADRSVPQPLGEGVRRTLARGQSPFAIVLCCADSRVVPEHVFNAGLGELFVIRVAGHAADPETIASIEYAVDHLSVPLCVVLGHEGCDAVAAAVAQVAAAGQEHPEPAPSAVLQGLLEQIEPAVRKVQKRELAGAELTDACEEEHAQLTVTECLRRSPLLRRFARVGRFKMVPARYHLLSGEVEWLPNRPLPAEPASAALRALPPVPVAAPPHVALRLLQAGHRRFLGDGLPAGDLSVTRREQLTHGERPLAIVLCCADSRVAPEHLFDAGLGELCVIRVAGNALNDHVLASIERGARDLGASLLVVLGHTRCGAVAAAAEHPEGQQLTPNLRALLARLEPPVEKARRGGATGQALVDLAVRANVQRVVVEARSRSAILRDLEQQGRLAMLPAVYDLASGEIVWLKDAAEPEAAPPPAPAGESAPPRHAGSAPQEKHGAATAPQHGREVPVPQQPPANDEDLTVVAPPPGADHPADPAAEDHGAPAAGVPEPADPTGGAASPWRDPILVVGLGGVASLLLAALVAVLKK